MGFKSCISVGLLASVLLFAPMAWGRAGGTSDEITVFVNDAAGVAPTVLRDAEREAAWLLGSAGIAIHWVNCAHSSDCQRPPRANEFELHIVPKALTGSDFVFGVAFLGPDGEGKYADVFFNRVRQGAIDIDVALLLGAVSAHELGHLLLGSHSHSLIGIMEPVWNSESLRKISRRTLTFTAEQQRSMKHRLGSERLSGTSVTQRGRLGLQ